MIFCDLAGSVCWYGVGAALIVAEDSLYQEDVGLGHPNHRYGSLSHTLQFLHLHTKLASPRLPLISLFSWLL